MLGIVIFASFAAAAPAAGSQPAPAVGAVVAEGEQKMRCRTEEMTGSLARRRRVCLTVAEWRKRDEEAVKSGEHILNAGLIRPTNGQ